MTKQASRRVIAVLLSAWTIQTISAAEPEAKQAFIRISRSSSKDPVSLDTAIVSYGGKQATGEVVNVDLIGAVHIAEKPYYDALNRSFRDYDAVLYELVAPANANVPTRGQRSGHPVGMMQIAMKNFLNLEFQLDLIDYRRPNFVHADLTPEEFSKSMEHRGESLTKLMFRLMGHGIAQQSAEPERSNDIALFGALFSRNRSQDLKRVMAQQFEEVEKANAVLDGPNGSTILTVRNRRAIQVLEQQLAAGKKNVAIFYGAAHLPDLDKRLRADFGLQPARERWLEAWNLRPAASPNGSPPPSHKPRPTREARPG